MKSLLTLLLFVLLVINVSSRSSLPGDPAFDDEIKEKVDRSVPDEGRVRNTMNNMREPRSKNPELRKESRQDFTELHEDKEEIVQSGDARPPFLIKSQEDLLHLTEVAFNRILEEFPNPEETVERTISVSMLERFFYIALNPDDQSIDENSKSQIVKGVRIFIEKSGLDRNPRALDKKFLQSWSTTTHISKLARSLERGSSSRERHLSRLEKIGKLLRDEL